MPEQQHDGSMAMPQDMPTPGDAAMPGGEIPPMDDPMGMMAPSQVQLVFVGLVDPGSLEAHTYANLLPRMLEKQFAELKESIELDGLQNPIILFQGKILDGRNRCRACRELGIPVLAFEFVGSEPRALIYVLSANQHRRDLTPSQRAVVAFDLQPRIAEDVNRSRIEKIRQARLNEAKGETLPKMAKSGDSAQEPISSRVIAADMMGVSHGYVGLAKRVKEASPELFERVRSGHITLTEAIKQIDGLTDDARATRVKTVRRLLNRLLGDDDESSEFLDRLEALVAEFSRR